MFARLAAAYCIFAFLPDQRCGILNFPSPSLEPSQEFHPQINAVFFESNPHLLIYTLKYPPFSTYSYDAARGEGLQLREPERHLDTD